MGAKKNTGIPSGPESENGLETYGAPSLNFQAPEIPQLGGNFGTNITQPSTFGDIAANATPQEPVQQPQQERKGVFSDLYNKLASGSSAIGEMIAGVPDFLYSIASVPQNILASAIENNAGPGTADWLRASYKEYEDIGPLASISKARDYYRGLSEDFNSQVTQFDDDIITSIGKGNFGDAGRQVANSIAESVPSIIAMVGSGGAATAAGAGRAGMMAASALPFASGEYQQIVDDPNIPETAKPVVAGLKGLSEVIFEQGFGTGKLVNDIIGKKIGQDGVKKFVTGYMDRILASNGIPASVAKGAISEASTTLSQNMVAKYSGENPDMDVWEGVADAAIVGSVMDATIATPSQVSRSITNRSERRQASQLSEANNQILEDLSNPEVNLTPEQRSILMDRYNQNTDAIDSYITKSEQERSRLTPRQQDIQRQMVNRTAALEEVMNNEALSDLTRQEAEAELESAQNRLDRQVEVDNAISEFQRNNPEIEVDYMEDLPDSVVNTFTRVEEGVPVDPVAVDEASQWMYGKYQELTRLKEDPARRITIEQIEGIQNQLGEDIAALENYKLEQYEQAEGETVRPEAAVADGTVAQETVSEPAEAIETAERVETLTETESIATEAATQAEPEASNPLRDSYNRLTEGMTPEQIESDPDLVRMRDRIDQLSDEQQNVTLTEYATEQTDIDTTVEPVAETITEQAQETAPERITYPKNDQEEKQWDKQVTDLLDIAPADVVDRYDYVSERVDKSTLDDLSDRETDLYMQAEQELSDISPTPDEDAKIDNLPDIISRIKEIRSQQTHENVTTTTESVSEPLPEPEITVDESAPVPQESGQQTATEQSQEQINEVTEITEPEVPAEPIAKKPKKASSLKEILTSAESRQSRASELRDRINKYRSERPSRGSGIAAEDPKKKAAYWRDVTDYAAIRIVDGAIATARQLSRELGIAETRELNKAFNEAKRIVSEDAELSMTTVRNSDTARKRAELGFDERIPVITQSNAETESNAREMLEQGYDVEGLIEEVMNGRIINATETSILAQYIAAQEARIINTGNDIELARDMSAQGFQSLVDARNRALDRLNRAYDAIEASGTEVGRAMQIRKANVYRDLSLANMLSDMRIAKGKVKLTDTEITDIQKKYKQMSDLSAEIRERNEQLEEENARLNALLQTEKIKADIEKAQRRSSERKSKPTRKEAVDAADKRLQEVLIPEFKKAFQEAFGVARFAAVPDAGKEAKARFRKAAYELIKGYIERILAAGGRVYVEDVVDRLYDEVVKIKPDITRAQIMNLIDSTNDDTRATKSELSNHLKNFRTELKLMNEISRLEAGGDLRDKIRRTVDPNTIRLDELRKRLKRLRDNIRRQNDPSNESKPVNEKPDDYDFNKQKESIEKRIKDYQDKIKSKDFAPERKQLVLDDPRLKDMRKELADLQFRYKVEVRKAELNRRHWVQKYILDTLVEAVAIPRTLLATGDMSALFRQMMFTVASRPILTAKAAGRMFQFWGSKKAYDDYFADYKASDAFQLANKSGLALTDVSDNINAQAREEMFMSNLVNKAEPYIPVFGGGAKIGRYTIPGLNLHKRAERSFTGAINKMRIDLFERGVNLLMDQQMYPDTHKKQYEQLASYVNAATGRGPMPESWSGIMSNLSAVFFAPRLMSSRLWLLSGGPLIGPFTGTNSVVRKMYLRDLISFIAFGTSVAGAAVAMGADVEDDPTSVDFGMVRVGDTRYDIWGGFSQYVRLIARMATGKMTSSTGRVTKLNSDEWGAMTYGDLLLRFGRSKLSPTASLITSALQGKNYMGDPFSWGQEIINMLHPLIIQDVREAWTEQEEGPWSLATTGLPAFFGVSVNTWRANEFLAQGVDDKLIQLTNDKKVATMMPEETRIKLYDLDTGEERQPDSEEFKRYLSLWSDYIKKDLSANYDKYKGMSEDGFDDKFKAIKSAASSYAKEQISGVSTYDKKFTSDGKTYELTPEQLRRRVDLNEEYIRDNDWRVYIEADKLEAKGMARDMALIEARKNLKTKARAYSKKEIEREFEGQLVEKE